MNAKENAGEVVGYAPRNQMPADNYVSGLSSLVYRTFMNRPANEDLIRGIR